MALFLEGGYDLPALEASLGESLASLADASRAADAPAAPAPIHEAEIQRTKKALREHWPGVA